MKDIKLLFVILISTIFLGCTQENENILVDGCGKLPDKCEVTIGDQIWMCKNLDVDHYRNGDSIPQVTDPNDWSRLKTGAWCYYNNDSVNGKTYGKLYNWYAVNDPRGLAPEGWHVPSDAEWTTLSNILGGDSIAGGKLKEAGLEHWQGPNTGATNAIGFKALPGGFREWDGDFFSIGATATFRTSTSYDQRTALMKAIHYNKIIIAQASYDKEYAYSVRCVKD